MTDPDRAEWLDDWQKAQEDPLRPSRGCLYPLAIALGVYALAATVAVIIMAVTR